MFLIIGSILHAIVFQQYNIKSISKDGIELEKSVEITVLENSNTIISKISEQLGALDEIVYALYEIGYVKKDLKLCEYTNLLERILVPIAHGYEGVYIQVFDYTKYLKFMKQEKGYSTGLIKKVFYGYTECGIIPVEDGIHIKYKLAGIQEFNEKEVYITIELGTLFDIKIGELIYGYIKCFEALYSKYI